MIVTKDIWRITFFKFLIIKFLKLIGDLLFLLPKRFSLKRFIKHWLVRFYHSVCNNKIQRLRSEDIYNKWKRESKNLFI